MSACAAKLLVFVEGRFACVKIIGRANFTSSVEFKTLLDELLQKGYDHFVLDLAQCLLMDSTFLGVLAGFGLKLSRAQKGDGGLALELLNASSRIVDLLETLGIIQLFTLRNAAPTDPSGTPAAMEVHCDGSPEELARTCLAAHEALMKINPENVSRFKDVAQFLAEDLKKLGAAKPEGSAG